jgi:hypothetical protein
MTVPPNTPRSNETIYRPARARRLSAGIACLVVSALVAWVALGSDVPPYLFDIVYAVLLTGRGEPMPADPVMTAFRQKLLLLFSVFLVAVGARWFQALWGLPRVVVTNEGIALKTMFGTKWASWESLARFEVRMGGRSARQAVAAVVGQAASKSVLREHRFIIPDAFATDLDPLVTDLNARLARALGKAFVPPEGDKAYKEAVPTS